MRKTGDMKRTGIERKDRTRRKKYGVMERDRGRGAEEVSQLQYDERKREERVEIN